VHVRRIASSLAVVGVFAASAATPAFALDMRPCELDGDFVCGTVRVPLDRSGRVKGTLSLRVAAQRAYPKGAGLMVALSGGPGQSSVSAAGSFADSLRPVLHRYRLVVLDQRGTGSGALLCPELQRLGSLDPFTPQAVLRCAQRVGPRRSFFSTPDTVQDLEALRRAFGAPKLALMGISYGTWVAQEYARRYPGRTDRLILDSVVGPQRSDGFFMDTYRRLPRVLGEQCAKSLCKGATKHPVADIGVVAKRLRKGPIRATTYDARGRARRATLTNEEQFAFLVSWGDLNPLLQARLPGAIAAASEGDFAPLLRLRPVAEGLPASARDFSSGLNAMTGCLDSGLPFPLTAAPADRPALVEAALAATPPSDYDPWSASMVRSSSFADDCLLFPRQASAHAPTLPLPDVPALVLAGRLDMRTPAENGRETAALLPRARVIEVPGNGHDQVDTDTTGCVARGLRRWINRLRVGKPCQGKSNQVDVAPQPPRSLSEFKPSRQVPGLRGSVLLAVMDSAVDVRFSALEAVFAGIEPRVGGLRGGSFSATDAFDGTVTLRRYEYVPGVRLSGTLRLAFDRVSGNVRVEGTMSGWLRLDTRTGASGVLGGRKVRFRRSRAGAASLGWREPRIPRSLLDRRMLERRLTALGLR